MVTVCVHISLFVLTPGMGRVHRRALLLAPSPPEQGLCEDVEVRLCLKGDSKSVDNNEERSLFQSLDAADICRTVKEH